MYMIVKPQISFNSFVQYGFKKPFTKKYNLFALETN